MINICTCGKRPELASMVGGDIRFAEYLDMDGDAFSIIYCLTARKMKITKISG